MNIAIGEYELKVLSPVHSSLRCTICSNVLQDPQQFPCGCRFCADCIGAYLNDGGKICPGRTEDCLEEVLHIDVDVRPDILARREVSKLIVKCCFQSCEHETELRDMKEHLQVCAETRMDCIMCEEGVTRGQYESHKANECRESVVSCVSCGETMRRWQLKDEHLNYEHDLLCSLYSDYCPNSCGETEKVPWKEHRGTCTVKYIPCPYHSIGCTCSNLTSNHMTVHMTERAYEHGEVLLKHIDNLTNELAFLTNSLSTVISDLGSMENKWRDLANEERLHNVKAMDGMKDDILRHVQNKLKVSNFLSKRHKNSVDLAEYRRLDEDVSRMRKEIDLVKTRPREVDLREHSGTSRREWSRGSKNIDKCHKMKETVLVWRLANFSELSRSTSPFFYTEKNGYKLSLSMDKCRGFLSVYAQLQCGEHDDELSWPFRRGITIKIVDQEGLGRDYDKTIKFDREAGRVCDRKYFTVSGDFGISKFISLQVLNERSYFVKDNELLIHCSTETLNS